MRNKCTALDSNPLPLSLLFIVINIPLVIEFVSPWDATAVPERKRDENIFGLGDLMLHFAQHVGSLGCFVEGDGLDDELL